MIRSKKWGWLVWQDFVRQIISVVSGARGLRTSLLHMCLLRCRYVKEQIYFLFNCWKENFVCLKSILLYYYFGKREWHLLVYSCSKYFRLFFSPWLYLWMPLINPWLDSKIWSRVYALRMLIMNLLFTILFPVNMFANHGQHLLRHLNSIGSS